MEILQEKDREQVKKVFKGLKEEVRLVLFTQETECQFCKIARELIEEVAGLSPKLKLEVHDFVKDAGLAAKQGVDKIPAVLVMGEKDYGIRFYGVPAGYEFTTLIEDILDVSRREHGLPKEILDSLAAVDKAVHIQVIVSPACPYCPRMVYMAHRFAMASKFITADMVEITEFPHLAQKYDVQGVPKTIINEEHSLIGMQPGKDLADAVLKALGKIPEPAAGSPPVDRGAVSTTSKR